MQNDLRTSMPDLDIEILGMNHYREGSGNADVSEGRDIPWLQDVDADGDNLNDNWLTSWPFVYRDVVIVDAENVAVSTFNLTVHSLEEPESYATLRQMLIDVAVGNIEAEDDTVEAMPDNTVDIDVLGNDSGLVRLDLIGVEGAQHGTAEIVTVEYPATLDSTDYPAPDLLLSEMVPGEYIELYNTRFEAIALDAVSQVIVSGEAELAVSELAGAGQMIPGRGYAQFPWPDAIQASSAFGEFVLYADSLTGFEDPAKLDDFVAWGAPIEKTRMDLAVATGKWEGPPDGTLDEGAIQRIPGTFGEEVHSYDNHRPATPGGAINNAVETQQVIRYTPNSDFKGSETLTYTVADYKDSEDVGTLTIIVGSEARPWQNHTNRFDVDNDGVVTPQDALAIINFLNEQYGLPLPAAPAAPLVPSPFLDCDGDSFVGPVDALLVLNELTRLNQPQAPLSGAQQATPEPPLALRDSFFASDFRLREMEEDTA